MVYSNNDFNSQYSRNKCKNCAKILILLSVFQLQVTMNCLMYLFAIGGIHSAPQGKNDNFGTLGNCIFFPNIEFNSR